MNYYKKVSVLERLPKIGKWVPVIDNAGEIAIYRFTENGSWNMRDGMADNSPNNNLAIDYWLEECEIIESELQNDSNLGKLGKDKITGFEGIIISKVDYLFGCAQLGLAPQKVKEDGSKNQTEYFDEGRIRIIGDGITAAEVQVAKPGADFNPDKPNN